MTAPIPYHLNGPATVSVAYYGSSLSVLGETVDGVTITRSVKHKPVYIDSYGSEIPYDMIWCGVIETIEMELVVYDTSVLSTVLKLLYANSTLGTLGTIGTGMVMSNTYARLLIASPVLNQPLNYPIALLVDDYGFTYNACDPVKPKLRWQAMPAQQSAGSSGSLLWNTTTS